MRSTYCTSLSSSHTASTSLPTWSICSATASGKRTRRRMMCAIGGLSPGSRLRAALRRMRSILMSAPCRTALCSASVCNSGKAQVPLLLLLLCREDRAERRPDRFYVSGTGVSMRKKYWCVGEHTWSDEKLLTCGRAETRAGKSGTGALVLSGVKGVSSIANSSIWHSWK